MLARHLSLQASEYVSFEHTRQSGPLCPGSHILMTVSGVVVGGPVVLVVGAGVVLLVMIWSIGSYTIIGGSKIVASGKPRSLSS